MAILGIDHVALVVESLEEAIRNYEELLQTEPHFEKLESEGVRVAAFTVGDSRVELLEPLSPDNPIGQYLRENGEGLHHVALRTDSTENELSRLSSSEQIRCIDDVPREGMDGYEIAFLHPSDLSGVLMELAQPSH